MWSRRHSLPFFPCTSFSSLPSSPIPQPPYISFPLLSPTLSSPVVTGCVLVLETAQSPYWESLTIQNIHIVCICPASVPPLMVTEAPSFRGTSLLSILFGCEELFITGPLPAYTSGHEIQAEPIRVLLWDFIASLSSEVTSWDDVSWSCL